MIPEWKMFLHNEGASFDEAGTVLGFGDPEMGPPPLTQIILCDLSYRGLIAVSGEEAVDFLQSQFTNDIKNVSDTHSQLSAYCNPKGRMLTSFRIFKRDDNLYLELPSELVASTLKRLQMFVLRAKVTLTDASQTLVSLGVTGPEADTLLAKVVGKLPNEPDNVAHIDGLSIIRIPGVHPRFEIHGECERAEDTWSHLRQMMQPANTMAWSLSEILAGIPNIRSHTSEAFVPQMANLDLIGGVSFTKGCYPGQEVVARMRYLGKLKRRMYLVRINADQHPQPGEKLYREASPNEQPCGTIVDSAPHPEGGIATLAVMQIADAKASAIHLDSPQGPGVLREDLPYEVTDS